MFHKSSILPKCKIFSEEKPQTKSSCFATRYILHNARCWQHKRVKYYFSIPLRTNENI